MGAQEVRPPAVAGLFYPGQGAELRSAVDALLVSATTDTADGTLKLLVVPHAGYAYSGRIAAAAYSLLAARRHAIRRVVLLGPTHRVAVRGIAIPSVEAFATPLGLVPVDRATVGHLAGLAGVLVSDAAHATEHSLEVQLPFLQTVLDDFTLVPLAVGNVADADVTRVLEELWDGDETVVIISSDLSHYHSYRSAQVSDRGAVDRILALASGLNHDQACGATPINGALAIARARGLRPRLLAMCNSGDTSGDRDRVVGYCSIAMEQPVHATP